MPIVDKINALTGKSAETIEDAIANMSGGGSGIETMNIECSITGGKAPVITVLSCSMTQAEATEKLENGPLIAHLDASIKATEAAPLMMYDIYSIALLCKAEIEGEMTTIVTATFAIGDTSKITMEYGKGAVEPALRYATAAPTVNPQ